MNKKQLLAELEKLGMRPGRGLGQNFLMDSNLLDWIVRHSAPAADEQILEVGPGFGALTGKLLASGAKVTAIEFDHRLADYLREKYKDTSLRLIEADACKVNYAELLRPTFEPFKKRRIHLVNARKSKLFTTGWVKVGIRTFNLLCTFIYPTDKSHLIIEQQIALCLSFTDKQCCCPALSATIEMRKVGIAQYVHIMNKESPPLKHVCRMTYATTSLKQFTAFIAEFYVYTARILMTPLFYHICKMMHVYNGL